MKDYATIVCPNGLVIKFRLRDQGCNRFKLVFFLQSERLEAKIKDWMLRGIDHDDCGGEDFATIVREVTEL